MDMDIHVGRSGDCLYAYQNNGDWIITGSNNLCQVKVSNVSLRKFNQPAVYLPMWMKVY